MSQKKTNPTYERNIALCYIRQSYTRDEDDTNSPERQRSNIQAACERNNWIPEWYEDVGGHKSGRSEKNRPAWLALKARLGDPDVVGLVANDLSRLHRKGWRVGDLIEYLDEYGISLVLAAPGREVDTSSVKGRMFLQFGAIIDEYYAEDISQRAKDSILYRKGQGKVVGLPPFGTTRDDEGYLIPSAEGAWYLPDGRFARGEGGNSPHEGAAWRSYYQCAMRILKLYSTGEHGLERISYQLNVEGWPFRDRNGEPRPVERDDIRRVVANWPEYGGLVTGKRGKDRAAYEDYNVDEIPFKEDRAVMAVSLLRAVARVRKERTVRPTNIGVNRETHPYPLIGITYCAHCERLAEYHNNPKLRSRLGGSDTYGKRRYRHKAGVKCGCDNRSVPCEIYESDFGRLIQLLTIRPDSFHLLTELAIQADQANGSDTEIDLETQKREAIALCQRRIDAAINLYRDGRIAREEYLKDVEHEERDIAHWEARTNETEKAAAELALCMDTINKLSRLWDRGTDEDKQGLARSLFSYLVYDLDTQRIVEFKLKPWADRFLKLRGTLYDNDTEDGDGDNGSPHDEGAPMRISSQMRQPVGSIPLGGKSFLTLEAARKVILNRLYQLPTETTSQKTFPQNECNE